MKDLAKVDMGGTAVFVIAAVGAVLLPDALGLPFAVLSCVLFTVGCIAFLWAYAKSIARSRHEHISVAGVFGLAGSTPPQIRRQFHLLTGVQVVVAVACAALRPFTVQAFGILAPMFGLGLGGLWAAQHGTFAQRARKEAQRHG